MNRYTAPALRPAISSRRSTELAFRFAVGFAPVDERKLDGREKVRLWVKTLNAGFI